jgi:hypothetical protein
MVDDNARVEMLKQLFRHAGSEISDHDLRIVSRLHASFAGQRDQLSGAARPETEPMIIPAFDRIALKREAIDERNG